MNVISREKARLLGLRYYFTGKPCKNGHVAERSVNWMNCRECNRAYHQQHHVRIAERHARKRFAKYGLTPELYESMLVAQGGVCAICKTSKPGGGGGRRHRSGKATGAHPKRFAVDHDHLAGHVRGLLCASCNRGIGYFADSPNRLRAAAAYLELR